MKVERAQRRALSKQLGVAGIQIHTLNNLLVKIDEHTLNAMTKREKDYLELLKKRLHQEGEALIQLGQRLRK